MVMKYYTRMELKNRIRLKAALNIGGIKQWCKRNDIYYEGLIRFLGGESYSLRSYTKVLEALKEGKEMKHYLAEKLTYDEIGELMEFIKQIDD